MSTPLSAKNALVRFGAYVLAARKWNVSPKVDALDATNFESGGFADFIAGVIECEFTVDAQWDSGSDPFGNPPNINVGVIGANVKLYTAGLASPYWNFPSVLVVSTPFTADVRGTLDVTFTCKAQGTFNSP
jgi:hypothetical protein